MLRVLFLSRCKPALACPSRFPTYGLLSSAATCKASKGMPCRRIHALMLEHSDPRLRHRAYLLLQRIGGRPAHFNPTYSEPNVFPSPAGVLIAGRAVQLKKCNARPSTKKFPALVVPLRSTCQWGSFVAFISSSAATRLVQHAHGERVVACLVMASLTCWHLSQGLLSRAAHLCCASAASAAAFNVLFTLERLLI